MAITRRSFIARIFGGAAVITAAPAIEKIAPQPALNHRHWNDPYTRFELKRKSLFKRRFGIKPNATLSSNEPVGKRQTWHINEQSFRNGGLHIKAHYTKPK